MKNLKNYALILILFVVPFAWAFHAGATDVQATVLTNLGGVADGTLSGLADVIGLRAPDEVTVIGPMQQYDIPVSTILQITVDFPRLVIETETGVVIGPYSSFLGIGEVLTLATDADESVVRIPVTALRAIALNGRALKPVPREWMGDHFLSEPEIVAAAPLQAATCEDCIITSPTTTSDESDSTVVWNTITPETATEEPATFPWWIGILAVGLLVVVVYFLGSGQSAG